MPRSSQISVEDEVLSNLRRQPLGGGTVADLNLPLELLRRVADRVIQQTFRERHRIVIRAPGDPAVEHAPPPTPAIIDEPLPPWITVLPECPDSEPAWHPCRPPRRGFFASILPGKPVESPEVPAGDPHFSGAADLIRTRLAIDGLESTHKKLNALGITDAAALKSLGLPIDWLDNAAAGARVLDESSGDGTIRLQLTSPGYYAGEGDGGSLDIARQLIAACSHTKVIAIVQREHAASIAEIAKRWTPAPATQFVIAPQRDIVSQWAQDNAKTAEAAGQTTLLAPRWAGRGEDGGSFIPGESLAMRTLAAAGIKVRQSRLIFEGGNAMLVREPSGRRILLLGEAEVARNTCLGLKRERVIHEFTREFAADECLVLPAASFHIDLEVSAREHHGEVVALVPDTMAAVRIICELAAQRLRDVDLMSAAACEACAAACRAGQLQKILELLGAAIGPHAAGTGAFTMQFAKLFRMSEVDSGVGNLQRILFALDCLVAEVAPPGRAPSDRHAAAYLRSIRRSEADRRALQRMLKQRGWRIAPIPAISSESLSINPINGLHLRDRFLMSAYGGFFGTLDAAAEKAISGAFFGRIAIQRMTTSETQRRAGGLHCAAHIM